MAQENSLPPLTRVTFRDWTGSQSSGHLIFHTANQTVYRCAFSSKTYMERDHKRIGILDIPEGQTLELLSEVITEPPRCRALIVRLVSKPEARARPGSVPSPTESFAPRGNLLLTGVVLRFSEWSLHLRTRSGESHTILLREDTRYYFDGAPVAHALLPLNRPLQIRAGKTYEGEVEAFSVTWGEILKPR